MPSPLGHALGGLAVHALTARDARDAWSVRRGLVVVAAAMAPDLDLVVQLVDGRHHHQAQSHSIGFAVLTGIAAAALAGALRWMRPVALGLSATAAWLSHIALDLLGRDTHPPIGLMALWPFSHGYFKFPWPVFMDIGRTLEWATVRHDLVAVSWEVLLLAPLAAACFWARWRHPA
jgi:hypothetical protein